MKLGSFLGFYCFFPKLIVEFLNKVGASDLFLSSCRICFSPHNLFHRNQVLEKLKGEGQQHHLQGQLNWNKDHPYCFMNNQISKRALMKFWAYHICEFRITTKADSRFWFEYWTLLQIINPHCLVQVSTVKYRFLIISCVQTLFFQAFNKKMSFLAFHSFRCIFHVLFSMFSF